jgi:hypothetical protein
MAMQPVKPALRLLPGQASCMAASCCSRVTWRFVPPRASVAMLVPRVRAHALVGAGLVVRGRDLCKAETCRARRRLVVRGGDLFL